MNPSLTLTTGLLLAPTFALYANENVSTDLKEPPLIPAGWDAALAGDQVMDGLVSVTAPR